MQKVTPEKLKKLNNLAGLTNLFCEEQNLNYEYSGSVLSKRQWKDKAAESAKELLLVATHQDFHIIYCQIEKLLLGTERLIINQLLKEHPYLLVIFSEPQFTNWHFVNVKYDEDTKKRKVFRRFVIAPDERLHTAAERLSLIEIKDEIISPLALQTEHDNAFDVDAVTKEFYKTYKTFFNWIIETIGQNRPQRETHSFTQQLLNRLMFVYFIQKLHQGEKEKKYWLNNDPFYLKNLWNRYQKNNWGKDKFYNLFLEGLFFYAFNKNFGLHNLGLPKEIASEYTGMPYLNGGLFSKNKKLDNLGFSVPDIIFEKLFNPNECIKDKEGKLYYGLLEHFNFTVREDTPLDVEVAVDPVMLGKVYESLVNEEERGRAGIFYTQPVELNFMCRSALIEYLDGKIPLSKAEIIHLITEIDNPENLPEFPAISLTALRESLENLKIVDPACGSGAFLVTMLNILVQLHSYIASQSGSEPNTFQLKKKIISYNLFGVDIKEWACHIAELRLWLSLIVETEGKFIDLYTNPLLPNLSFKIRSGDSLVEEIAGKSISLRGEIIHIGSGLRQKINELLRLKQAYFDNRLDKTAGEERIKKMQDELFKGIINDGVIEIDKRMATLKFTKPQQQTKLFIKTQEQRQLFEKEEREKRAKDEIEIKELSQEKDTLLNIQQEGKRKFFWDIDFAEVFAKGGFDLVIGNPPYVRQEMLTPQYKEQLLRSVQTQWGNNLKMEKRSDLYVYFYLHGLSLLSPDGVFCFITSNSWLDVGYGRCLQEFLLRNIKTKLIYDNLAKRSFAASDVNTVITLFQRPEKKENLSSELVKFVAFKKPFEEVINSDNLISIENNRENINTSDFRLRALTQSKLLTEGMEPEKQKVPSKETKGVKEPSAPYLSLGKEYLGKYVGEKWGGKYLRAPDIFFKILEKGKGKLVRLGDIAEIRRGITTGANEFFYLDDKKIKEWGIEEEFLKPVIKSPRECKSILIKPEDLKYKVFMCHKSKEELKGTKALEYIEWGEFQHFHQRPSCKTRPQWWDLRKRKIGNVTCMMSLNDRYPFWLNGVSLCDARLYDIYTRKNNLNAFTGALNSTYLAIFIELTGRANLGEGVLDFKVYESAELPVLDVMTLTIPQCMALADVFQKLSTRPIKSIFEELGLPKPNRDFSNINPKDISLNKILPDRRALDKIVFSAIGLTEEEQLEVYQAVAELVKNRLSKARSV